MKQWLKEVIHNCVIHPLMMFLPANIAKKMHDDNATWCWGLERYDELELETVKKQK